MEKYKIEVKWAMIFLAMQLLWMLMERLVGLHGTHIDKHMIFTNFMAIPAITVYVFALRDKRQTCYGGTMTYKQGFISGLIISLIVMIFSPASQWIISTLITPDYFANIIEYAVATGYLDRAAAEAQFNMKSYMIQGLIGAPIMGIVTSAIVAAFVKSKK